MAAASFDWSQYLRLADELGASVDEASLRSAISRAYYFVYHLALQRALTNSFTVIRGEATHSQLWRFFSGSPDPACQKLGVAERLKEKRIRADYEGLYSRIAEDVPLLLEDARRFVALLDVLPDRLPNPASVRR